MQSEPIENFTPFDLTRAAQDFAAEAAGTAERKKKTLPSPTGLQTFFLYVRAEGYVPMHQVAGPITVQAVLGTARIMSQDAIYELGHGSIISIPAAVPHDVTASTESVLLITQALRN